MEAGAAVGREARFHDLPGAVRAPHVPFDRRRLGLFLPPKATRSAPLSRAYTLRMALSASSDVSRRCWTKQVSTEVLTPLGGLFRQASPARGLVQPTKSMATMQHFAQAHSC